MLTTVFRKEGRCSPNLVSEFSINVTELSICIFNFLVVL